MRKKFTVIASILGVFLLGYLLGTTGLALSSPSFFEHPLRTIANTAIAQVPTALYAREMLDFFDMDSTGTLYVKGVVLRTEGAGSVETGTSTNPLRVDVTNTTNQDVNVHNGAGTAITSTTVGALEGLSVVDEKAKTTLATIGAALPTVARYCGYNGDGSLMQGARVYDADTASPGTNYLLATELRYPASGGSVTFGDATTPIRVDPTGTTAQPVTDNAGSLTVDWNGTAPPIGAGLEATGLRVTIATDSTGLISVDDNGSSLTVDASDLDIRNLAVTTDEVLCYGNTAKDGTGTDYVPLLDAAGHSQIDVLSVAASALAPAAFTPPVTACGADCTALSTQALVKGSVLHADEGNTVNILIGGTNLTCNFPLTPGRDLTINQDNVDNIFCKYAISGTANLYVFGE